MRIYHLHIFSRRLRTNILNTKKANVIFVLFDDLSWGDLGAFEQAKIHTPCMDALAANGLRFNACYAGAPVCAPSRSTLMQGRHLGHATVRDNMSAVPTSSGGKGCNVYRHCLQTDDLTVAHIFKKAGYATGIFGKWGLALSGQSGLPNDAGFDEFFGYLNQRKAHNYYPPYLWHNRQKVELPQNIGHDHRGEHRYDKEGRHLVNGVSDPAKACYSFDLCHEKAIQFIRDHGDSSFFLYLPVTIPHGALEVPDLGQYANKDWPLKQKVYAAMITRLDQALQELVDTLKKMGAYDQTLFIFASDNGYSFKGQGEGNVTLDDFFTHSGPYAGTKGNLNQGGVRVPAFAYWPGHTPVGGESNTPWMFCDFLPTVCDLLEIEVPDGVDGVSILGILAGQEESFDRDHIYWEFRDEQALRKDAWWIQRKKPCAPVEIYDADGDPSQSQDRASEMPDLVAYAEEIFAKEHEPTLYFASPGESREIWWSRLKAAGLQLPDNSDN